MFCILIYDIAINSNEDEKRLQKVYEICKKYLQHIEFSVFYGEINKKRLLELIKELKNVIDKNRDSIIFYLFRNREDIKEIIKFNIKEFSRVI